MRSMLIDQVETPVRSFSQDNGLLQLRERSKRCKDFSGPRTSFLDRVFMRRF
jgi:hypothetical protein